MIKDLSFCVAGKEARAACNTVPSDFRTIGDFSNAILDFEWQNNVAQKLKMSQDQLQKIHTRLGTS
jgi:hypothetical protein